MYYCLFKLHCSSRVFPAFISQSHKYVSLFCLTLYNWQLCWTVCAAFILPLNVLWYHPQLHDPKISSYFLQTLTSFKCRPLLNHSKLPWHFIHYLLYYLWHFLIGTIILTNMSYHSFLIISLRKVMDTNWPF